MPLKFPLENIRQASLIERRGLIVTGTPVHMCPRARIW